MLRHGDLVRCHRAFYSHWAIYDAKEREFIEFSGDWETTVGYFRSANDLGYVVATPARQFFAREKGHKLSIIEFPPDAFVYPPDEVVQRARNNNFEG